MNQIQENQFKPGISGLEKIIEGYRIKMESVEREADEIIKDAKNKAQQVANMMKETATKEADNIILEANNRANEIEKEANDRARKDADNIILEARNRVNEIEKKVNDRAKKEADNIILEANNRVNQIEREANNKAKKEAKDRTKREVERIERDLAEAKLMAERQSAELINQAKKGAEEIVREAQLSAHIKALYESEAIILEAKEKAKTVNEDSIARSEEANALITGVCQKTEDIYDLVKTKVKEDLADLATQLGQVRNKIEVKSTLGKYEVDKNDNETLENNQLKGRKELSIVQPFDIRQIKNLREAIKQIPNVKIDGETGSEECFSIYVVMAEPVPLINILLGLSLVESFSVRGNKIELKLKSNDDVDRELIDLLGSGVHNQQNSLAIQSRD